MVKFVARLATVNVNSGSIGSDFLSSLNSAQLQAVQHSPSIPLQILAGPGSGKTKVLISRVAHLICHHDIAPSSICAVTFTNKAANEMRQRLTKLLGDEITSQIKMGTFHALCANFLRRYGNAIALERNFTVCDAEESKKLITEFFKPYKAELAQTDNTLKESTILDKISKAKAKGFDAAAMREACNAARSLIPSITDQINSIVSDIYENYEKALNRSNSLDFDDLLLFGVKLFRNHPKAVDWCSHVLIDEFQDTNIIQYELMVELAVHKCITVVGDPDQSIYGWRSAEIGNLTRMQKDYPKTEQIFLEENYRSTGSILNASLAIVAQDKTRVQKSLFTSHPIGSTPVLRALQDEHDEARYIASEIKRVVAYTGSLLNYRDFAILLRFTALSRTLESALQKVGIPSRVLGGHKFFDRLEVKDLLAYLQLIDNSDYNPAFIRAVNVPSRGVGDKTLDGLSSVAQSKNLSTLALVQNICDNRIPDLKPPIKRKLGNFIKVIQKLKIFASEGMSPPDLLHQLLELVDYENHLKKTQKDWESRWENVKELITFASEVNTDSPPLGEEELELVERPTPLRLFLQASMLSSEGDGDKENQKEKVTLVTCHAAKGLEWPVVFIPSGNAFGRAVCDSSLTTDDVEEESVHSCPMSSLSHTHNEEKSGSGNEKEVYFPFCFSRSEAVSNVPPGLDASQIHAMSHMLGRPEPDKEQIQKQIEEYRQRFPEQEYPGAATPSPDYRARTQDYNPLNPPGQQLSQPVQAGFAHSTSKVPLIKRALSLQVPLVPTNTPTGVNQVLQRIDPSSFNKPGGPLGTFDAGPSATEATSEDQNLPLHPGTKRRLGVGRNNTGYANKKFKSPT
ncbi:hypothetical protein AGABI1DRAFT_104902 [Agaricus bisporus var. burnettii JB137-S8]|uniref:DNA 3'-5' helicase n=1 Tax=Agaricus bisporus var. burnettii (strain JB137-S8 / ATCC MYA-4627 / FGSC 10392) TaxID=597362 RepID=K5XIN8_AGABU|nr:uncharacterized protein AGABI1DRAFT_104902 [Agaricus bisporus var. burnettii JB137-S8]EKM83172.1 hypothetical protein AGABI1DRAFT_104902 [Agaricus bisporus var. burnettii JB137-S8]